MKLVLVTSLTAVLALGLSGKAEAHGYAPASGGSFYWADSGVAIGLSYGQPIVAPYYAPPRYVYRPRYYGGYYGKGYHKGKHRGYKKGYKRGYKKGYRSARYDYHRRDGRRGHHRDWDD